MAEFNLEKIFASAFGYNPPTNFSIPTAPDRINTGQLGGKFYEDDLWGREMFLPVSINDYVLPFAVISIVCKKTIVATAMPERGGTVKELISIDDYDINIKGILIDDNGNYPELEVIDLHELFLLNEPVQLNCVLTDIFLKGSFNQMVVIKDLKFPSVTGVEHAKPYEISLESDMIFDLVKKSK